MKISDSKRKEKKKLPGKITQLVSCKDRTQNQVSWLQSPSFCYIIFPSATLAQRSPYSFVSWKRRRQASVCVWVEVRGLAQAASEGKSPFGSLFQASTIIAKGALSQPTQALRIPTSFTLPHRPKEQGWNGIQPGQSHFFEDSSPKQICSPKHTALKKKLEYFTSKTTVFYPL